MWNRFLHKLRLARGLSFSDWLALVEAWWALAVFYLALRGMSYERLSGVGFSSINKPPIHSSLRGGWSPWHRPPGQVSRRLRSVPVASNLPVSRGDCFAENARNDGMLGMSESNRGLLNLTAASEPLPAARRLHRLVGWASHMHLLSMTCLAQSLALRWMLNRRGISSQLKVGAAKVSETFHAHAWLEMDGEKIGESEDGNGIFRALAGRTLP